MSGKSPEGTLAPDSAALPNGTAAPASLSRTQVGKVLGFIGALLAAYGVGKYEGGAEERRTEEMVRGVRDSALTDLLQRIEHTSTEENRTEMSAPEKLQLIHQYAQLQQDRMKGEQYIREHGELPPEEWYQEK